MNNNPSLIGLDRRFAATHRWLALFAIVTLVGASGLGPLDPPTGPVAPTGKPLSEVEPRIAINATNTPGDATSVYKITQPGSYYLTGDVQGVANKAGIQLAASDVSIDLNGFTLRGAASSRSALTVTPGNAALTRYHIRNGSITDWGNSAVSLTNSNTGSGIGSIVENLRVANCLGQNVVVGGNSIVRGVIVENAGDVAIYAPSGNALVESCEVNTGVFYGVFAGNNSVIRACRISGIGGTGSGIATSGSCRVVDCVCTGNGYGISVDTSCFVSGCIVSSNANDGIVMNTGCVAINNACHLNGNATTNGAGIHTWSFATDCRIEGNNLTQNRRGLWVQGGGSFIARNTASGNTLNNWDVTAGNIILVVQGAAAGAVTGNAGGAAPGSTDPNANFSY